MQPVLVNVVQFLCFSEEKWDVVSFQDCMICMERLSCPSGYDSPEGGSQALQPSTVGKFTKCGHTLHMLCMLAMYNNGNKVWCTLWRTSRSRACMRKATC